MADRDCDEYDKECKYFHHEPYYTPNNYDLFFDYSSIPVNIPVEKSHDLRNRLQKLMPVTKIIHLNMDSELFEEDNNVHLHTKLKLNYNTLEESIETWIRIKGMWNDLEEDLTSTVTYELSSLYDEETPISNAKIRLVNIHYPIMEYYTTTNSEGVCVFEDLPYGSYVQQVLMDDYSIPLTIVEVDEAETEFKILIGSQNEDSEEDADLTLNLYKNGVLIVASLIYADGEVTSTTSSETYDKGKLTVEGDDREYDDSVTILLNSPGFDVVNDFTEFTVEILGANNEVMVIVSLNLKNNYTQTSKKLPIYNADGDTRIEYSLNSTQNNCELETEYIDVTRFKANEKVLL